MDENGRAMDIAFPSIMGMYQVSFTTIDNLLSSN